MKNGIKTKIIPIPLFRLSFINATNPKIRNPNGTIKRHIIQWSKNILKIRFILGLLSTTLETSPITIPSLLLFVSVIPQMFANALYYHSYPEKSQDIKSCLLSLYRKDFKNIKCLFPISLNIPQLP